MRSGGLHCLPLYWQVLILFHFINVLVFVHSLLIQQSTLIIFNGFFKIDYERTFSVRISFPSFCSSVFWRKLENDVNLITLFYLRIKPMLIIFRDPLFVTSLLLLLLAGTHCNVLSKCM